MVTFWRAGSSIYKCVKPPFSFDTSRSGIRVVVAHGSEGDGDFSINIISWLSLHPVIYARSEFQLLTFHERIFISAPPDLVHACFTRKGTSFKLHDFGVCCASAAMAFNSGLLSN